MRDIWISVHSSASSVPMSIMWPSWHFYFLWSFDPHSESWPPIKTIEHPKIGRTSQSDQSNAETCTWTAHKTHNRQPFMPPTGFEPTFTEGDRPQTHTLDRVATGTGSWRVIMIIGTGSWRVIMITGTGSWRVIMIIGTGSWRVIMITGTGSWRVIMIIGTGSWRVIMIMLLCLS